MCDYDDSTITIIYKVVGEGTAQMSKLQQGEELDCLVGLGNGYDISKSKAPLVIGGGVGIPPLYNLTKRLLADGQKPIIILGFNTESEIFYLDEFRALGCEVRVTTVDGSFGTKGFVTDAMARITIIFTPAARCRCSGRLRLRCRPRGSTVLRSEWAAASVLVWAAPAKRSTAISASARMAPCLKGRKSYGRPFR